MNVVLETEWDRHYEEAFMRRFMAAAPDGHACYRMPKFSIVDYILTRDDTVRSMLELKIRKEPMEQVKGYGGLMLKHRKITELATLAESAKTDVWVVFAFDNGTGDVLAAKPKELINLPLEDPPRRRNYRGLATDEEPVCYLDWDRHLTRWRM